MAILEVKKLKISFRTNNGTVKAVRDISFSLEKGKTLAIVGESGSGKSVTSRAILGISAGNAIIESGEIVYDGKDLLKCTEEDMYHIRGDKIAMIFQDPLSSLNPIVKIGKQITEAMLLKNKATRKEARRDFNNMLANLKEAMHETAEKDGLDPQKIDEIIKTFDEFNIKGNQLEVAYEYDKSLVEDSSSAIKEAILKLEHKHKFDVAAMCRTIHKRLTRVNNKYFLHGIEDSIKEDISLIETSFETAKSLRGLSGEEYENAKHSIVESFKNIDKSFDEILTRDELDFFRLGYYILCNPDADLSALSYAEINEKTLAYLDEEYMPVFRKYTAAALYHSVYKTLEYKKDVVKYLEEFKEYLKSGNFTHAEIKQKVKELRPILHDSIDPLKTQKDSAAFILCNAILQNAKKYYQSIKLNAKDERRYNRQIKSYNDKIAKGRKIDYKVVPQKIISLEDIVNDMLSSMQAVIDKYNSSISKFDDHKYAKWDKISVLLIDYLKAKAKDVVFKLTKTHAKEKAIKLMEEVSIPEARARFNQYPFEFSGGMRQRIVIAIALSAEPEILICDEPTTALDVTIQSQILELINDLKKRRNLSIIFITHDLGVVANMADEIAVMYAGKIVEKGTANDIFYSPAHPYTWALLSSMPDLDTKEKLDSIPGTPPNMIYPPKGDAFAARNKYALKIDFEEQPPMFKISDTHYAATWLLDPRAPKVEMPKIIKERIARMKQKNAEKKGASK